ncbi:hypothetical protein KY329_03465 [Candidatus Woesearchaeota archaeon]|nr:hypothetical protein [Candidatus Woesearchaeota archaeon]
MKKSIRNNLIAVAALVIIVVAAYFYMTYTPEKPKLDVVMLDNETPEINISYFTVDADCEECFDINEAVDFIKALPGVDMTEITADADPVAKYSIKKLPTIVLKGDVDKLQIPGFRRSGDALVLEDVPAPFFDVESKEIAGRVGMIIIENPECTECFDPSIVINNLNMVGVDLTDVEMLNYTSEKAQELIAKYNIAKLPAMIFTNDLLAYAPVRDVWNASGTIEEDGMLVTRDVSPPFYSIATGEVRGIVDLTVLTDDSCTECYDPSVHRAMLENQFMVRFGDETKVDVSSEEGKALIEKYNITYAPTVILSDEAALYPLLPSVWSNAGTIEEDGSFIIRKINTVPGIKFKNLSSGKVVEGKR